MSETDLYAAVTGNQYKRVGGRWWRWTARQALASMILYACVYVCLRFTCVPDGRPFAVAAAAAPSPPPLHAHDTVCVVARQAIQLR